MASEDLIISSRVTINGWELTEQFILAGGPAGRMSTRSRAPSSSSSR